MAEASENQVRVLCPKCGAPEGLAVSLHRLTLRCAACDEVVTPEGLMRLIRDVYKLKDLLVRMAQG